QRSLSSERHGTSRGVLEGRGRDRPRLPDRLGASPEKAHHHGLARRPRDIEDMARDFSRRWLRNEDDHPGAPVPAQSLDPGEHHETSDALVEIVSADADEL